MKRSRLGDGFTLIEIMVVLAVVGILASITLPSYADYHRRAISREGVVALMGLATLQERTRLLTGNYADAETLLAQRQLPRRVANHFKLNVDVHAGYWAMRLLPHFTDDAFQQIELDSRGHRSPAHLWP